MNHYTDKNSGVRYSVLEIESRNKEAKRKAFELQRDLYGYNFCVDCLSNGSNTRLDPSHTKSVDKCKKDGDIETIWSLDNIQIRCRECHQILDKLV